MTPHPIGYGALTTIAIAQEQPIQTHIVVKGLREHVSHLARARFLHVATLTVRKAAGILFFAKILDYYPNLPLGFTPATKPLIPARCLARPALNLTVPGIRKKILAVVTCT